MRRSCASFVAVLAVSLAARAQLVESTIQPAYDLNWSMTAGRTVGLGNGAILAQAGWPGIEFTYLKGVDERTDWGFHLGLNYGLFGTHEQLNGVNLAIPYRHTLGGLGDTAFAVEAQPGIFLYSNDGALFGVGGPLGVVVGFKFDPRLTLDLRAEVPVLFSFTNPTGFIFGAEFGAGGEYLLDRNLAATLKFTIGPEFSLNSDTTSTTTGFSALIGLAYNMR
jgi:hypothetical protein